MNIRKMLMQEAAREQKKALPILSFPAVQKLHVSVNDLVHSAELQARAMETVARETDTIAAVSLMDLSVEAEAFGAEIRFSENEVPAVTGQLVTDEDAADALEVPAAGAGRTGLFAQAIALAKQALPDKPVLAGMIGPFSLAGRLMDVTEIMYTCYDEPETVHKVLEKATAFLTEYGKLLRKSGADGIVLAEPLAGIMSPDMMEEFSAPYVTRLAEALQDEDFGLIYHNCGNAVPRMMDAIFAQGCAACHFGNAVDMEEILKAAPADVPCMGNIDPAGEFAQGTPESIAAATRALLDKCGSYPNFVLSSGCDIPHHASWDNIAAFFAAAAEWKKN